MTTFKVHISGDRNVLFEGEVEAESPQVALLKALARVLEYPTTTLGYVSVDPVGSGVQK
jgi:hypothetical protein